MSTSDPITAAVTWLKGEVERSDYAEIGVRLVVHAGRVVRVERTILTKEGVA